MGWLLFAVLSCVIGHDSLYEKYPVNQKVQVFVIGVPYKKASWAMPPSVRICGVTEVSTFRVTLALKYWEKLGYRFNGVMTDSSPTCMTAKYGEILITLPESGFGGGQIASTKIYTHIKNNDIVKAKIFIMPRHARRERVLEHEVGHALGWTHYNQKFHMMHPNWFAGGYASKGLRK